jgi:hypothetical protein
MVIPFAFMLLGGVSFTSQAITPLPVSKQITSVQKDVSRYRLVLSGLKTEQATTFGKDERRLSGTLNRTVWRLQDDLSINELFLFYREQFAGDARVLYECLGLDCGSSAFWANEVFDNPRLVTREKDQAYIAALSDVDDGMQKVTAVYIARRGSRQTMINVDEVMTADPVSDRQSLAAQVHDELTRSSGWLSGFKTNKDQLDENASRELLDILANLNPALKSRLHLVVHCYSAPHMEDNLRCSERLAESLRQRVSSSNNPVQIYAHGALTLAPENNLAPALRFVFWPRR